MSPNHNKPEDEYGDAFPLIFAHERDYRQIDRFAGFWLAMGLEVEIVNTGTHWALVLHAPIQNTSSSA
jgi:hypothetical protein